jgi:hypothetical protein
VVADAELVEQLGYVGVVYQEIVVLLSDRYAASFAGSADDAASSATTPAFTNALSGTEETLTRHGRVAVRIGGRAARVSLARVKRLKAGRYSLTVTVAGHRMITRSIQFR